MKNKVPSDVFKFIFGNMEVADIFPDANLSMAPVQWSRVGSCGKVIGGDYY